MQTFLSRFRSDCYSLSKTCKMALVLIFVNSSGMVRAESSDAYQNFLNSQQKDQGAETALEGILGGSAAVLIGVYGYYYTKPNPVVKLVYTATQTAGVVAIGQALRKTNSPRLALDIDSYFQENKERQLSYEQYKSIATRNSLRGSIGEVSTLAYTSMILAGLYGFNAYRETSEDATLKNVYYFLSGNFAIVSAVSFYQLRKLEKESNEAIFLYFSPLPVLVSRF